MGLDMYLTKRHYVQKWDHHKEEETFDVTVTKGGEDYPYINPSKVSYVFEEAAYWRKANAIHGWFVENVQDGIDQCQESHVSPRNINDLHEACCEALANKDNPGDILPTKSGFFFGGTEYDEWYWEDIKRTKEVCESILSDMGDGAYLPYDLYYQASW